MPVRSTSGCDRIADDLQQRPGGDHRRARAPPNSCCRLAEDALEASRRRPRARRRGRRRSSRLAGPSAVSDHRAVPPIAAGRPAPARPRLGNVRRPVTGLHPAGSPARRRHGVVGRADLHHCHAAQVPGSTATRASSACSRSRGPRFRHDHQPDRRRAADGGRRRDRDRDGPLEGPVALHDDGRQLNPHDARLQAPDLRRRARRSTVHWVRDHPRQRPRGSKGFGEPPRSPPPAAIGNALAQATGRPVHRLPMTSRARVGGDAVVSPHPSRRPASSRRSSALASERRPVTGGTDLVVGARQGKAPLPASLVAIDRLGRAVRHRDGEDSVLGSARSPAMPTSNPSALAASASPAFAALADASGTDRLPATRHVGTLGGNVMNASPAMDTGGPARRASAPRWCSDSSAA